MHMFEASYLCCKKERHGSHSALIHQLLKAAGHCRGGGRNGRKLFVCEEEEQKVYKLLFSELLVDASVAFSLSCLLTVDGTTGLIDWAGCWMDHIVMWK
jgi:hypothetical protein